MVERTANGETMQRSVGRLGGQIRETVQSLLKEKKERIAMAVAGFADAFRQAARALDRNQQSGAGSYAGRIAVRIERVSAGVRNDSLTDMVASADSFAHRRPRLFVAGAIAVGFVLSRLLSRPARRDALVEFGTTHGRL